MGVDWSGLPSDVWISILEKLPAVDYIRSGCVCVQWRSIVREGKKRFRSEQLLPWLLPRQGRNQETLRFVNMADNNKVYRIHLPELRESYIIGTSEGWLIAADKKDSALRALNPITRAQIRFPPTATFPSVSGVNHDPQGRIVTYAVEHGGNTRELSPAVISTNYFRKVILHPTATDRRIVVVMYDYQGELAFAREGDQVWTALDVSATGRIPSEFRDVLFHKGLFYAIDYWGYVLAFDFNCDSQGQLPSLKAVYGGGPYIGISDLKMIVPHEYLVGSPVDENIMVIKFCRRFNQFVLKLFRLDDDRFRWLEVDSLGGEHVLFLGYKCCLTCNLASLSHGGFPELKGNCIYIPRNRFVDVFNLEDERAEPSLPVSSSTIRSPRWIIPQLF